MITPDFYSILGVLPHAEAVVVTAAYRALAQQYHPDKWHGDPAIAHTRMCELNEAYRVLSDPRLRDEYDAKRRNDPPASFQADDSEATDHAFNAALQQLEERWSVAVEVFPDLAGTRASLAKMSASLAFSFVTVLLDSRQFTHRAALADGLQRQFLGRYFGSNDCILSYARELIYGGHRDAAKMLNGLVDVMGSNVEPDLLIAHVEKRYMLRAKRIEHHAAELLASEVKANGYFVDALKLARTLGYEVREESSGFFGIRLEIAVNSPDGKARVFHSTLEFTTWVQASLCP